MGQVFPDAPPQTLCWFVVNPTLGLEELPMRLSFRVVRFSDAFLVNKSRGSFGVLRYSACHMQNRAKSNIALRYRRCANTAYKIT